MVVLVSHFRNLHGDEMIKKRFFESLYVINYSSVFSSKHIRVDHNRSSTKRHSKWCFPGVLIVAVFVCMQSNVF